MRAFLCALLIAASSGVELRAQAGGFVDGDLYLYTRAATGLTFADGGLIAIDPATGQTEQVLGFDYSSLRTGAAAFDSYRKRVLFTASIDDPADVGTFSLWSMDGSGAIERLIHPTKVFQGISPTGDGRVYVADPYDVFQPFQWIDAANRMRTLFAADGVTPFQMAGFVNHTGSAMTYDAATNALFVAAATLYGGSCSGSGGSDINIRKLPLSADGSRVVGPIGCLQVDVDLAQATEKPVNWSRGPNGSLLLVVDNINLTDEYDRMLRVDPAAFTVSAFASNGGYLGAADGTAGAYSSVLDKAVLVDTRNDVLRAFAAGETGAGSVIAPSGPLSYAVGSNEVATLLEIDNGPCGGAFHPFGVGLAGAAGEVPALIAEGCAEVGGSMTLRVDGAVGGAPGYLLVGVTQADLPFLGGSLHVAPVLASFPLLLGGAAGTPGVGEITIPFGPLDQPSFAGVTIFMQGVFADAHAPQGASLTQGLRVDIDG